MARKKMSVLEEIKGILERNYYHDLTHKQIVKRLLKRRGLKYSADTRRYFDKYFYKTDGVRYFYGTNEGKYAYRYSVRNHL